MPEYLVRWEMDIEAESAQAAALHALKVHRNPDSTATFFEVFQKDEGCLEAPEMVDCLELESDE